MRPARLTAAAAVAGAAACVRVDPGPNGIASARLDGAPPSIVAGDYLRDAAGDSTVLAAAAFDESGRPVPTAQLRFVYVPSRRDTLNRPLADTALVVDSLTGAVRATSPFLLAQGLVAVRVGGRLQLVDTLAIVPRPDSAQSDTAVKVPLRFDCADTSRVQSQRLLRTPEQAIDTGYFYNAIGPFRVLVLGDSAGAGVHVRRRLVRWTVEGAPDVPPVQLPGSPSGVTVPAISVVPFTNASDRVLAADTTDATGRSAVRLRIRPTALNTLQVPSDTFTVTLRAAVQRGSAAVRGSPVLFPVKIERRPNATCP